LPGPLVANFCTTQSSTVCVRNAPLAGDTLYGGQDAAALIARTALHARSIELPHPATHEPLHVEAPHPPDYARALRQLRGH
jgi:hypothetical protein